MWSRLILWIIYKYKWLYVINNYPSQQTVFNRQEGRKTPKTESFIIKGKPIDHTNKFGGKKENFFFFFHSISLKVLFFNPQISKIHLQIPKRCHLWSFPNQKKSSLLILSLLLPIYIPELDGYSSQNRNKNRVG